MPGKDIYQKIDRALSENNLNEAQQLITKALAHSEQDATLLYLQGKVHMKQSQWSQAMTCFLQSEKLTPEGPARQCRLMLNDIMEFYNKDMYNQ